MTVLDEAPHYKYNPSRELSIICAPFYGGQDKHGVEKGPRYMLKRGLENELKELGWDTKVEVPLDEQKLFELTQQTEKNDRYNQVKRPTMVGRVAEEMYTTVLEVMDTGRFPLTLGGDHSISIGTVSAMLEKYPDAGLLWIDAHADIHTMDTTISGNLHGCPVSFLLGLNRKEILPESFNWCAGKLQPNKIAYIGLRDVEAAEKKILKDLGIAAFSMYHIDRYGLNAVIEMAIRAIHPNGEGPIMCSYDVDSIDPMFVPATGTPVRGGMTLREGLFLAERLAETGCLIGLDIVECNPDLATTEEQVEDTIRTGCSIARCALGETLL